jgi:hypothetical protein
LLATAAAPVELMAAAAAVLFGHVSLVICCAVAFHCLLDWLQLCVPSLLLLFSDWRLYVTPIQHHDDARHHNSTSRCIT